MGHEHRLGHRDLAERQGHVRDGAPGAGGSITLHQDGGRRRLVLDDIWATYNAEVTQE